MNSRYLLHQLVLFHCKREKAACTMCRALANEGMKFCILDIDPPGKNVQRPIIEVSLHEKQYYFEFDILKSFNNRDEALKFVKAKKWELIESD